MQYIQFYCFNNFKIIFQRFFFFFLLFSSQRPSQFLKNPFNLQWISINLSDIWWLSIDICSIDFLIKDFRWSLVDKDNCQPLDWQIASVPKWQISIYSSSVCNLSSFNVDDLQDSKDRGDQKDERTNEAQQEARRTNGNKVIHPFIY